ncbi:RHS repeat domain-containing protein, partial [Streptosporangium sp. OZ121]|uniref:RHS repeat domain-containing protein n=1 Tax=Streptosporangium sp. OZ121 TaxID=3444183 RepID=UPI003F7ABC13
GRKDTHPYGFAPLDRVVDGDDHQVRYTYATVGRTAAAPAAGHPREFVLTGIDYVAPGAQQEYARVRFGYGAPVFCGDPASGMLPVGARLDYQLGYGRLSGTRKLVQVTTETAKTSGAAGYDTRSVYTLSYDSATEGCAGVTAPFRQLTSVQRTVNRPVVAGQTGPGQTVLPATTFTYGKAASYTQDDDYEPAVPTVANLKMPESVDTNQFFSFDPDNPNQWRFTPVTSHVGCVETFCPTPNSATGPPFHGASGSWLLSTGQATGESVARMWVDLDGDGRTDMLARSGGLPKLASAAPQSGGCQVEVYLNKSTGFVKQAAGGEFAPFSLRKAMGDIPVKAATPDSGDGELLCTLSRSFSPDASGGYRGDAAKACHTENDWRAPASWKSMQQARHAFMDLDGDRLPDLVTQTIASVDCPYASTQAIPAPVYQHSMHEETLNPDPHWEPAFVDGTVDPIRAEEAPARAITKRQRYLYVYRNTGSGFAAAPVRIEAGGITESAPQGRLSGPQSGVMSSYTTGSPQHSVTMAEFNGDGQPDVIYDSGYHSTARSWVSIGSAVGSQTTTAWTPVQLADEDQNLHLGPARSRVDRVVDPDPPGDPALDRDGGYTGYFRNGMGLDINGDGLTDKIRDATFNGNSPDVFFNTGAGFGTEANGGQVAFSRDHADTSRLESFRAPDLMDKNWQYYPQTGERWGKSRMLDMDRDGIADLLFHDKEAGRARLYTGSGTAWSRSLPADVSVAAALAGRIVATGTTFGGSVQEFADRADYRYAATHQAADLNGDGLLDLIEDGDGDGVPAVRYAKQIIDRSPAHAAPARLLRSVSNGSGATTTVTYYRDSAAGKWVAQNVRVDPGHGQPAIATDTSYLDPVFVAGPYGQHGFAGFAEVHTYAGKDSVEAGDDRTDVVRYDYTKSPAGLAVLSAGVLGHVPAAPLADSQPKVMRLVESTYTLSADLGRAPGMRADYPSRVVLPEETVSYTCTGAAGQTLAACRTSGAKVRQITDWDRQEVGGKYVMDLPAKTDTIFTNGQGKQETRRSRSLYRLAWTSAVFNVAADLTSTEVALDGATGTELGRVRYAYHDEHFRFVKTITVEDGDEDIPDKTSRFVYYGGTGVNRGQLYRTWAPQQVADGNDSIDSPGYTQYGYDVHGVHVVRTEGPVRYADNPIRHVVKTVIDPGTGAVLESEGPNYGCPDGPDVGSVPDPATACSFDQADQANLTELVRTHVDGLGRPTRSLSFAIGDTARTQGAEISRTTYDDRAAELGTGTGRVSIVAEDPVGDGERGRSVIEVDGLGRALRTSIDQDGSRTRTNTFTYDAHGRAQDVFVPRADGTAGVVGFRTRYDALGREVEVAEHGTTFTPLQRTTYDGLKTTTAQLSTGSSPAKQTTLTTDAVGQLLTVGEQLIDPIDAVTRYAYDGAGNTAKVTDPDGITTTFTHDYSGNRLSSTTAGRTWRYGYDRNDNPTSVTEPLPPGANADDYTHRNVYDAADRLIRQIPAVRDLTETQRAEFKIGATDYVYDLPHPSLEAAGGQAGYSVGRLTSATSPALTTISR